MPVAMPVALPIVTNDALLTHVPPVEPIVYVPTVPTQIGFRPPMVPGDAFTVTTLVVAQPPTV